MTSPLCSYTTDWADGTYTFRLVMGPLYEVEELCDKSILELLQNVAAGRLRAPHIRHIIRLALIGGKDKSPVEAEHLCRFYVDERPIMELLPLVTSILNAALNGGKEAQDEGKATAEPAEAMGDSAEASSLPTLQ